MTSTPKRSTELPQRASNFPISPESCQFGEFEVSRIGWRYRVVRRCSDGIMRDTFTGRFFRWITAARIARELNCVHYDPVPNRFDRDPEVYRMSDLIRRAQKGSPR